MYVLEWIRMYGLRFNIPCFLLFTKRNSTVKHFKGVPEVKLQGFRMRYTGTILSIARKISSSDKLRKSKT